MNRVAARSCRITNRSADAVAITAGVTIARVDTHTSSGHKKTRAAGLQLGRIKSPASLTGDSQALQEGAQPGLTIKKDGTAWEPPDRSAAFWARNTEHLHLDSVRPGCQPSRVVAAHGVPTAHATREGSDNYSCHMTVESRSSRLRNELYELAWSYAQDQLHAAEVHMAREVRPHNPGVPTRHRLEAYLAMLTVFTEMTDELTREIDTAIVGALGAGANYAAIARSQRTTRQAVRQKWQKKITPVPVTLSGGPYDATDDSAAPGEDIRYPFRDGGERLGEQSSHHILYRKKYGTPAVYEFIGYEDDQGNLSPQPPRRSPLRPATETWHHSEPSTAGSSYPQKIRVHELARELGVPSKNILRDLVSLGAYVRSASSTVEPSDARAVRDIYRSKRPRYDRR